jgi:serine/threonine-protein kinase
MSPEQAQGERGDERSDIYALGVILYELTTGRLPFESETPFATLIKHIQEPVPAPHCFNPDLPPAIEQAILKAMAKDPRDRYGTAGEFAQFISGRGILG